jgi:hypothetical protein
MSESAFFLILGAFFSVSLAWGLVTGHMPTKYRYGDRAKHPGWYWSAGAMNTLMAVTCFWMAWAKW